MRYSRWQAPLVGILVGVGVTCFNAIFGEWRNLGFWTPVFASAGLGLVGGVLALLADPSPSEIPDDFSVRPTFSANVLALLGLLAFFMPFIGLALSALAISANRRIRGWAWYLAWLAFLLSCGMTSMFVWWNWTHPR